MSQDDDKIEMIQSVLQSISDKEKLKFLKKIIENIATKEDEKQRKLKCSNEKLNKQIFSDENIVLILDLLCFEKTELEGDECYFLSYKEMSQKLFSNVNDAIQHQLDKLDTNGFQQEEKHENLQFNNNVNIDRLLYPKINQTNWTQQNRIEQNKNQQFDVRNLQTEDIRLTYDAQSKRGSDILFNMDQSCILWLHNQQNLVYGQDINNLKNLKKFIDKFHKMQNGNQPDMLETKLRTKFGDGFWRDQFQCKQEIPIFELVDIIFEEDLSQYEFQSKLFKMTNNSQGQSIKHYKIVEKIKKSLISRWDHQKTGILTLRELDLILINLKFDKLFLEKIQFDFSRYHFINESIDQFMQFNFNIQLKKLRENNITSLEEINIDLIKKFNLNDYSTINNAMMNQDNIEQNHKLSQMSNFTFNNNVTDNQNTENNQICPLNNEGKMEGFGAFKCADQVQVGYFSNDEFSGQGLIWVKNVNKFVQGNFTHNVIDKFHLLRDLNTYQDIVGDWENDTLDSQLGCIIKQDSKWHPQSVTRSSFFNMQAQGYTQVHNLSQNQFNEYFIDADKQVVFGYRMKAYPDQQQTPLNTEQQVGQINDGQIEFQDEKFIRKGLFKQNKLEGWGVEIDLKNGVVQEGSFDQDRRSGQGQMIKGGDVQLGLFDGDTFTEAAYQEYSLKFEHILMI